MYHVPAAPQTHVTREIVCICCNERFTIAIDTPNRKKGHHKSDKWHVPANQISTTILRFAPHSHQQMITPPGRAEPENDPKEEAHHDQDKEYYINCPRCGADNRNWLNAQTHKFPYQKPFWIGFGLVIFMSLIALWFFYRESGRLVFSLGLGGAVIAVGLLPLFIIPTLWSDYRLRNYLDDVAPDAPEGTTPQWKAAFTIWGFFLLFVFVLMLLRPIRVWVADLFQPEETPVGQLNTLIANSQELDLLYESGNQSVINSYHNLANLLNRERKYAECDNANLEERVAELEAARNTEVNMFAFALERLRAIPDTVPEVCQKLLYIEAVAILKAVQAEGLNDACLGLGPQCDDTFALDTITEIETIIASMPDPPAPYSSETAAGRNQILATAQGKLIAGNYTPATGSLIAANVSTLDNALLATNDEKSLGVDWMILISLLVTAFLSWYSGTTFGISAMKKRAEKIDSQLPRPIYSDLTNMTRLAIWELKKSLEAETYIDHVQWMEASHDAAGGLILIGLHRGLPEFNAFGMRTGSTVRAQRYEIRTNRWVRVISAKIEDVEVPSTIDTPDLIEFESWPREVENGRNQPEPVYNTITPGNRGYVINGESTSHQSDRSPQTGATAVSTPNVTPHSDEPVPPPLYFRAGSGDTATHSASGELTLAQISQLGREICAHFSENELRSLCFDLDVNFDSLPGSNTREKTNEMIRHFSQRGQINDLLRILRIKRPNFNWRIMG